ncbi:MAG: hypothetical protein ACBR50_11720 [Microcoleus sp.]
MGNSGYWGLFKRAIALFVIKGDRAFEPQMHADGRGWGKGRLSFWNV